MKFLLLIAVIIFVFGIIYRQKLKELFLRKMHLDNVIIVSNINKKLKDLKKGKAIK